MKGFRYLTGLLIILPLLWLGAGTPVNAGYQGYITFDGPPWFVDSMATAVGNLIDGDSYTNYFFWWASQNSVTIHHWPDAPSGYSWGHSLEDKSVWVGTSLAVDSRVNAAFLATQIMYLRDYYTIGECVSHWSAMRASMQGYLVGTVLGVPEPVETYLLSEYRGWSEATRILDNGVSPTTILDEPGGTPRPICVGWENGGF